MKNKQLWMDLIAKDMVTEKDIDRIIENEKLRQFIVDLRDYNKPITPEEVLNQLTEYTRSLSR